MILFVHFFFLSTQHFLFFSRLLLGHVHGILTVHIIYMLDYRSYNSYPQVIHSCHAGTCITSTDCLSVKYMQNGTLLVFDMRQTLRPVESVVGLTCNPIHSMYSLVPDSTLPSGVRSLLTASSSGLCQWNFGAIEER